MPLEERVDRIEDKGVNACTLRGGKCLEACVAALIESEIVRGHYYARAAGRAADATPFRPILLRFVIVPHVHPALPCLV